MDVLVDILLAYCTVMAEGDDDLPQYLYDYCLEHDRHTLLDQWDTVKNAPLTVQSISYGSRRKVWWICANGHHWQAAVYTRTGSGTSCPYCTGKRACPGENDLASSFPEIAAQWHPLKNGGVTPDMVTAGSHHKAWWVCDKGHEWQAAVKSRAEGSGCPVCRSRVLIPGCNDLATTHPALSAQWHPRKNGVLQPTDLMAGTRRKVWWQCEKSHEWQAAVSSRVSGAGCPVCAGKVVLSGENDLASSFPEIAAQWHPVKNTGLSAETVSPYSNRKVWWQCELGHEYAAAVSARTMHGSGCPYCAGRKVLVGFNDLATLEPQLAAQWHPTLNGTLTPQMVTTGSHKKVWWQCAYGHVWHAIVNSRAGTQKCGCPVCAGRVQKRRGASDGLQHPW